MEVNVKEFTITLYLEGRQVGRVVYSLADRASLGCVTFTTSDNALRHALLPLMCKRWTWPVLLLRLKSTTRGLVPRFCLTPSPDGRGTDTVLRRKFI